MHDISLPDEHKYLQFGSFDTSLAQLILDDEEQAGNVIDETAFVWKEKRYVIPEK